MEKGAWFQMSTREAELPLVMTPRLKPERKRKDRRLFPEELAWPEAKQGHWPPRLAALESGKKQNIECQRKSGETEREILEN